MGTPEEIGDGETRAARPKRNADQTRQNILVAAGRRFSRAGYANVRLKDIADDVGITAPLVIRYFGSKEALFREVAMDEAGPTIASADLDGPLDTLGRRMAQLCVRYWLDRTANFPSIALIRSLDFEEAKGLFITEFARRLIRPLTETLPGPDAEIRAKLISAQFMGVGLFGLGLLTDPDAVPPGETERERLIELLAAALQISISRG
ncbi:MAG TPA: TetR family transcriptional regulator [Pseudonocardia sp.]|jgi:AcrR family transcriptional regulator|nr:TetR family transcriptional regulator [Pseudonocardia sp.]